MHTLTLSSPVLNITLIVERPKKKCPHTNVLFVAGFLFGFSQQENPDYYKLSDDYIQSLWNYYPSLHKHQNNGWVNFNRIPVINNV